MHAAGLEPAQDFSTLFDLLPIGAYRISREGVPLRVNAAMLAISGFASEQELRTQVSNVGAWYVDQARHRQLVHQLKTQGHVSGFVSEVTRHNTGERIWISEAAHVVRDAQGHVLYYEGTVEDITARVRTDNALRASEHRYRALTDNARVLTLLVARCGTIRYINAQAQRMLGFEPAALVSTDMMALLHPDDATLSMNGFQEVLAHMNPGIETPVRVRCADGAWKVLGVVGVDFLQDPDILGVVLNARDITEELEIKKALTHAARNDPLTNLPNRAYFEALFAQAQNKVASHQQQALLFIDLDRFKWVNDSLGHPVGDRVLVRVAELLRITVTGMGQVGRLGGDEFCISIVASSTQAVQDIAARIVDLLDQPLRDSGQAILLGASVGVALYPQHGKTYDELLRNADLAMFRAKSCGGGTVCMFSEDMAGEAQTHLQLATDLRVAIGAGQIDVAYQPQFDLNTGLLRGFEALARWTHAQHGQVPPDRFIPIAEQSGQIGLLGRLVMDKALIQARAWLAAGVPDLHLAVNVSAQQLRDSRFADEVAQRLQASGMNPRQFEVEITENSIVSASAQTKADLQRLRANGVLIAIDDLGVGYSSLAYLKNLPVDVVKLDRSFISGLPHDRYDCALTNALTVLARTLNIELIAEGVETAEQAKYLATLGCRLGQGYYFSKPLPPDEALGLVVRQRVAAAA
ncbi:MAG: hypothetical protein RL341_941 [Pseudomonadota bacterium]